MQDADASNPPQQRQMVMPDRMKWIYRDPTGNKQGPWSGLEMHDWYKAGFFSPELQVRKLEDSEYEPLASMIRRIGNSREPFLVPQIGIAHGPAGPSIPGAEGKGPPAPTGSAQPPFAGAFPSFGTTLTAEQQNALERRKQEEQYLMARQKEYLAQHQNQLKMQQHMGGMHPQQLHHQSSGHSLHSQPSYGSITSPPFPAPLGSASLQTPIAGSGFFEGQMRSADPLGPSNMSSNRDDEMSTYLERLNLGRQAQQQQQQFFNPNQANQDHQQQVNAMLQERARQAKEQEQFDSRQLQTDEARSSADRLAEYNRLRAAQEDDAQFAQPGPIGGHVNRLSGPPQQTQDHFDQRASYEQRQPEPLSLSEQVQKAAANQPTTQPQSPWGKIEAGPPQPLPPPPSDSPMPAPTPQRNRQSVAEALNAESESPPQQDSVETPTASMAPWAKDNNEATKGPSLKEIQAMEAQKAAKQEETQAAARRAMAEQERINQQNQTASAVPQPGLPSSANWASGVTPAVPAAAPTSPWAKPGAGKPAVATPVSATKKTLAQIQKEEEVKKNRALAASANIVASAPTSVSATAGNKRYADLASRGGQPQPAPNPTNAAWTTVGAGGKAKTPAPPTGPGSRTASGNALSTAPKTKPTVTTTKSTQQMATEELHRWTKAALGKGLDSKIPRMSCAIPFHIRY